MDKFSPVFLALRKGTLLEEINLFGDEQLRPFLPLLMQIAFKDGGQITTEMGQVRARLIKMNACNDLFQYRSLDYSMIEAKCCVELAGKGADDFKMLQNDRPFVTLGPLDRVLHVCAHLIWTKESNTREKLQFMPFDIGCVHPGLMEEIGCILALLCLNCPELFSPNELAKQLLNYELAPTFIAMMAMNLPDLFEPVLDPLVLLMKQPDDESFVANQTRRTVLKLFQLDPQQAQRFMAILMDCEKGAKRTVQMLCSDWVDDHFYVNSLIAHFSSRNSEFVNFLTKAANKPSMRTVCQRLGAVMERCQSDGVSDELEGRVVLLVSLLASCASLRLTTDEGRHWVAFLTRESVSDDVSLQITLATILASPNLMPDQVSFRDEQIGRSLASFFSRLHALVQLPEYSLLSNVMTLIYVHLITDNAEDLANLLSSILSHKVPKTLAKQPFVRELYIQHAINQEDIVKKAANISVTKRLNGTMAGYLPVHCISAMLHWRSFSRYSTPIQEWVKAQLLECRAPIHPFVTNLLEDFASSCIPNETFPHFNQPIDEQFFEEIFSGDIFDESRLVLRILSLAYLVAYNYKLDTATLPRDQLGANKIPQPYSQQLWKSIPIRYLLIMVDSRHADFQHIRPMIQRYMVLSMPHILPEQMHFDSFKRSSHFPSAREGSAHDTASFTSALDEAVSTRRFTRFASQLDSILDLPIQLQFRHYPTILRAMAASLDECWPRAVVEKLAGLWESFESVVPRKLHEDTIRLWLQAPLAASVPMLELRDSDFLVAHTPLVLFRADKRVFQSPPHLRCFCRLLSFYLAASRDTNYMRLAKAINCNTKAEMTEKEELLRSFIGTQRLAVVQVFIELCDGGEPGEHPNLEECQQILCNQIHQFFIADTHLPKLVHFNMYPMRLIPVIVRRVPSVHVLLSSINELLTGGNLERRIFAVILTTELLEQYKIPTAFGVLTLISDLLDTLASNAVDEEYFVLMLNIVPCLARLTMMSPFHAEHFLATMQRTRQLAQTRLSLYTSLTQARVSPEQQLMDLLDQTLENLPKLPPQEAVATVSANP